jgi:hypothetical protein
VIWFKRREVMAGTACPPAVPQRRHRALAGGDVGALRD